ncbi:hypothetical protein GCM10022282_21750 [Agromyces indicus]
MHQEGLGDLPDPESEEPQRDHPQEDHAERPTRHLLHGTALIGFASRTLRDGDRDRTDHDVDDPENHISDSGQDFEDP